MALMIGDFWATHVVKSFRKAQKLDLAGVIPGLVYSRLREKKVISFLPVAQKVGGVRSDEGTSPRSRSGLPNYWTRP